MKLLLLCLALPILVALAFDVAILVVHQAGLLDALVRSVIGGLLQRLSGRPP